MIKKILLVTGDPNSINTEIIFKTWKKINQSTKNKIYLISNDKLFKAQLKKLNYSLKVFKVENINQQTKNGCLKLINVNLKFSNPYNVSKSKRSIFIKNCLDKAHDLASQISGTGIINCAIDKALLGNQKIGVTEYLAAKCKVKKDSEVMIIKIKIYQCFQLSHRCERNFRKINSKK